MRTRKRGKWYTNNSLLIKGLGLYLLFAMFFVLTSCSGKKPVEHANETVTPIEQPKSTKNDWEDVIDKTIETGGQVADAIRENNAERRANQEDVWAYRLGMPKSEKAVMKAYEKVGIIPGTRIFQVDKDDFWLVIKCEEAFNQTEEDSLKSQMARINGLSDREIKKINLSSKCTSRQKIKEDRKQILKKGPYVNCFICE